MTTRLGAWSQQGMSTRDFQNSPCAAIGSLSLGEGGSTFVPDGTRFVLARPPSDESLGYFRASLRDLDSDCSWEVSTSNSGRALQP